MIQNILQIKHQSHLEPSEELSVSLLKDKDGFWLKALLGTSKRAHEFVFVSEDADHELLTEYFDGVLTEFFAADRRAYLPLDFSKRTYDGKVLWAKQEFRDFEAEELAEKWLGLS
ncbi:MAG: hypothetical protein V4534_08970 [Myxococcota bacterium]